MSKKVLRKRETRHIMSHFSIQRIELRKYETKRPVKWGRLILFDTQQHLRQTPAIIITVLLCQCLFLQKAQLKGLLSNLLVFQTTMAHMNFLVIFEQQQSLYPRKRASEMAIVNRTKVSWQMTPPPHFVKRCRFICNITV